MNLPTASCGVSGARILPPSSLKFALQRLKTLLATTPLRFIPAASCGVFSLDFIKVTENGIVASKIVLPKSRPDAATHYRHHPLLGCGMVRLRKNMEF